MNKSKLSLIIRNECKQHLLFVWVGVIYPAPSIGTCFVEGLRFVWGEAPLHRNLALVGEKPQKQVCPLYPCVLFPCDLQRMLDQLFHVFMSSRRLMVYCLLQPSYLPFWSGQLLSNIAEFKTFISINHCHLLKV